MKILKCHCSTTYNEIIDFINENKGKTIKFHYEIKGYNRWGNDEIIEIKLDEEGYTFINNYLGTQLEFLKNGACVHNIEVID